MRFLQLRKFSYLIGRLHGIENLRNEDLDDLENNPGVYLRFLRSVLTEHSISFAFLALVVYQCLYALEIDTKMRKSISNTTIFTNQSDQKLPSNVFARSIFDPIISRRFESIRMNRSGSSKLAALEFIRTNTTSTLERITRKFLLNNKKQDESSSVSVKIIAHQSSSSIDILDDDFISSLRLIEHSIRNSRVSAWDNMSLVLAYHNKPHNYLYRLELDLEHAKKPLRVEFTPNYLKTNILSLKYVLLLLFLALFLGFFLLDEIMEIKTHRLDYFRYLLNCNDLLLVLVLAKHITESVLLLIDPKWDFLARDTTKPFLLILTWTRQFKYFNFTRGLTLMNATLAHSLDYLVCYFLVHTLVFTAHSELLRRFFGQNMSEYSSFVLAQLELFKLLLASANMNEHALANSFAYQCIFYSFFLLVYIMLTGIFLAIVNDAYSHVTRTYDTRPELEYALLWKKPERENEQARKTKTVDETSQDDHASENHEDFLDDLSSLGSGNYFEFDSNYSSFRQQQKRKKLVEFDHIRKRRFSKPAWFHIEQTINADDDDEPTNDEEIKVENQSNLHNEESSSRKKEDYLTQEDYLNMKSELDECEERLNKMANFFLDLYYNNIVNIDD